MRGIKTGMVMQRNDQNVCEIFLESNQLITEAHYERAATGQASIKKCGENRYCLSGIPVGGPYTVIVNDESFTDVYVGDVWVLAGQSNMEGVGWFTEGDKSYQGEEHIRMLQMKDEWGVANHPLHPLWTAFDKVHTEVLGASKPEVIFRGVGPGLAFAQKMFEYTKVPQGLLCCAHGGTSMAQWSPSLKGKGGDKSLYAAMLRRFQTNGSHVRGMFWHQGCSEAMGQTNDIFIDTMQDFVAECRRDFEADIPVVQVQISRVLDVVPDTQALLWNDIREKQRCLSKHISGLCTISTISKPLDDCIHLSSAGQKELGEEAAECMVNLLYGEKNDCLPPVTYLGHKVVADSHTGMAIIEVTYDHVHGELTATGRPNGFEVSKQKETITKNLVFDIQLQGNTARLRTTRSPEQLDGFWLYYGFGLNPYCNITDGAARSLPAMGPIALFR